MINSALRHAARSRYPCGDTYGIPHREAPGMPPRSAARNGSRRSACASSLGKSTPTTSTRSARTPRSTAINDATVLMTVTAPASSTSAIAISAIARPLRNRRQRGSAVAAAAPRSASSSGAASRADHIGAALNIIAVTSESTAAAPMARASMAISPAPYMRTGTHARMHRASTWRLASSPQMPLPRAATLSVTI